MPRDGNSRIPIALHSAKSTRAGRCRSRDLPGPRGGELARRGVCGGIRGCLAAAGHGGAWVVPWGRCPRCSTPLPQPKPRHLPAPALVSLLPPCHFFRVTGCNGTSMAGPAATPPGPNALGTAFSWDLEALLGHTGRFGGFSDNTHPSGPASVAEP